MRRLRGMREINNLASVVIALRSAKEGEEAGSGGATGKSPAAAMSTSKDQNRKQSLAQVFSGAARDSVGVMKITKHQREVS